MLYLNSSGGVKMKKIFQHTINICIITSLLIVSIYTPDVKAEEATTLRQLKEEYAKFKEDYENNQLQQELTEEERTKIKQNINNIETTIANTQDEISEIKKEIEKLNEDIDYKESEIESLLSYYQISSGESAYLEYAFGAKDFTDFIYRVAVSEQLTTYNNSLVEQYKASIEASKQKSQELTTKITELEKQQETLNQELIKLADELEKLADDAFSIEDEMMLVEKKIKMYEDLGCELDEDLEACVKDNLITDTGFLRPLKEGHITSFPGPRNYGGAIGTYHHGLDFSNYGANYTDYPVYAIANGKVVAAFTNYKCGGRMVYIEHNINGTLYTSAYWHLRRIDVKEGQVVTSDTQIGIMGGTETWDPCTTGAHLHLELSLSKATNGKDGIISITRANWLYPEDYINVPSQTYVHWTNRYKAF